MWGNLVQKVLETLNVRCLHNHICFEMRWLSQFPFFFFGKKSNFAFCNNCSLKENNREREKIELFGSSRSQAFSGVRFWFNSSMFFSCVQKKLCWKESSLFFGRNRKTFAMFSSSSPLPVASSGKRVVIVFNSVTRSHTSEHNYLFLLQSYALRIGLEVNCQMQDMAFNVLALHTLLPPLTSCHLFNTTAYQIFQLLLFTLNTWIITMIHYIFLIDENNRHKFWLHT